jgi:hypothetical protein
VTYGAYAGLIASTQTQRETVDAGASGSGAFSPWLLLLASGLLLFRLKKSKWGESR